MTISITGGASISGGVRVINNYQLIYTADLRLSPATTLSGVADGTNVTSLTNIGTSGSTYDATAAANYPTVATQNSVKVMQLDSSTRFGLSMSNSFLATGSASIFVVAYQTGIQRVVALGGATGVAPNCFFGFGGQNGTAILFRNSTDAGVDMTGLSTLTGLKVFGLIKDSVNSTLTYYDNNNTPLTTTYPSGTYDFRRIGYRDSFGVQKSDGYLGDIVGFSRVLTNTEALSVIASLKSLYNIA